MFLQRHKLDMSKSTCYHVIGQQWGNLAVTQRSIVLFGNSPPRTEMHFVNRQRFAPSLPFLSFSDPCSIAKLVFCLENNRRSIGRHFHHEGVGIGFEKLAPAVLDFVFVELTGLQTRNEKLPNA